MSPRSERSLAVDCAQASLNAQRTLKEDEVSLYVGIPFCPTRCAYCSFVSADVGRTLKLLEPYLDALLEEIDALGRILERTGKGLRTFYMGGGTPTTLSAVQLDRLLTRCREVLPLEGCTEYTVEAGRPDTIDRAKLEVLKGHGVGPHLHQSPDPGGPCAPGHRTETRRRGHPGGQRPGPVSGL